MYLVYDVRGIQRFIFAVPKLKCIIGGSLIVDAFDRKETPELAERCGWQKVYTGGGRGLFTSDDGANLEKFKSQLIKLANDHGLDIRLGTSDTSEKIPEATDLYPYQPTIHSDVTYYPCALSGLWPVTKSHAVHDLMKKRIELGRLQPPERLYSDGSQNESFIAEARWTLQEEHEDVLCEHLKKEVQLEFFRNVSPDDVLEEMLPEDEQLPPTKQQLEQREALAAARALGSRNRWAVVCMDGNDMGRQIACMTKTLAGGALTEEEEKPEYRERWFKKFSKSLADCTKEAFLEALSETVKKWLEDQLKVKNQQEKNQQEKNQQEKNANRLDSFMISDDDGQLRLILPFRPLILGGDDVTLLCHSSYAIFFVQKMSAAFSKYADNAAKEARAEGIQRLWPATDNHLTISAGVLFCKTSFPLASAMGYAESLLASAKSSFREKGGGKPSAAAVDWETITETLVDSPAERRQREMWFRDGELVTPGNPEDKGKELRLTSKPYSMEELKLLLDDSEGSMWNVLSGLPGSIRGNLLPGLRQPWSRRMAFLASLGKRHPELWNKLKDSLVDPPESRDAKTTWWFSSKDGEQTVRKTSVMDVLSLLDEMKRLTQNTIGGESRSD